MESQYHWLITVTLVTSSVVAVTANAFLLLIFCRRRGLRTVPNRFVINLLVTNLLSSILLIPLLLTDQGLSSVANATAASNVSIDRIYIEENILVGNIEIIKTTENVTVESQDQKPQEEEDQGTPLLCYFAQSSTSFVCTASIFSILLIGVNQYFGVIHSLRYHFYINKCRSSIFIAVSWLVSLLCSVLNSLTYSDSTVWNFCQETRQPTVHMRIFNTLYAFVYFIVVILAPFVAICLIYVCIYNAAHKNSERMRKSKSSNANLDRMVAQTPKLGLPKVHSAPNFTNLLDAQQSCAFQVQIATVKKVQRTSSERQTNSFITNLRHKISNASVFRYREETRAAKISIIVILTVLICYIPYGVTLVLSCDLIRIKPTQFFNYLSLILLVFSNIISPFLFGYRNKRVKREIGRLLGLDQAQAAQKNKRVLRNRSLDDIREAFDQTMAQEPFLASELSIPKVVVTYKHETERKSILKKYTSSWGNYKKCNFISVPESCISGEARGSFSSASTQISSEE